MVRHLLGKGASVGVKDTVRQSVTLALAGWLDPCLHRITEWPH